MATRLYVGGIAGASQTDLQELFAEFKSLGQIKIITDRETNAPRGFSFVEFSDDEEAQTVIKNFNGKDFNGKDLEVNVARPQADRPANGGGGSSRGGNFRPNRY